VLRARSTAMATEFDAVENAGELNDKVDCVIIWCLKLVPHELLRAVWCHVSWWVLCHYRAGGEDQCSPVGCLGFLRISGIMTIRPT
jgi:hypothetical protein